MALVQEVAENRPIVLVADDDETTRVFLQYHLEKAGFRVVVARDGRAAVDLLSENVQVALLDLDMPDPGGLACLRHIRKNHPDVESIIVTSSGEIGDAVQAMKDGAFDYVTKPVNVDELIEAAERAARTSQLARENRQLRQAIGIPSAEVPFIGQSSAARRVGELVDRIAALDSTVWSRG
jgi:DNA-binding NtrC family response regulator